MQYAKYRVQIYLYCDIVSIFIIETNNIYNVDFAWYV